MNYGQRGGDGPNRGKTAAIYVAHFDGVAVEIKSFNVTAPSAKATGLVQKDGRIKGFVWPGEPPWSGDFPPTAATRVK